MVIQYQTGGERLSSVFYTLNNYGFQDFFLPFIMMFALVFAVLQKVKLFKNKKQVGTNTVEEADKRINGFISAAVSLMIVIPHVLRLYPANLDPIEMLAWILPASAVGMVAVLLGLLIIGFTATDPTKRNSSSIVVALIGVSLVLIAALRTIWPAIIPDWLMIDPQTQSVLIVVGIMLVTIWFIVAEETTGGKTNSEKLKEIFG